MSLINKLQAKLELYRLEQRYARRKHRNSFTTGAQYIDGEYIYKNNNSNTSPAASTSTVSKQSSWKSSGKWKAK